MLFLIEVDIDYAGLGDRREATLRAEWVETERLIAAGIAIREWRKADGSGVVAVWDCEDRAALDAILARVPLAPWLAGVAVTPLAEHPLWPGGRPRPGGGAG